MKRVSSSIHVNADLDATWAVVGDMSRFAEFFVGATAWDPIGTVRHDIGDRYHVLIKVGSIDAGGVIELTDVEEKSHLVFRSVEGLDFRGEVRVEAEPGGTKATVALEMHLRGGPPARLVEQLAGRILRNNVYATLEALRHDVEWGEPAL